MKSLLKKYPRAFTILFFSVFAIGAGIAIPAWQYRKVSETTSIQSSEKTADGGEIQVAPGQLQQGTPTFRTLLPAGKTIKDFGGWTKVSPPNRDPVYAYVDKIGAIPINVSQQPLPDDFVNDTEEKVEQLALAYAADKKLNVGDAIAFIGTSAKGPQSVILAKNNLLILIKASAAIPNAQWEKYIKSLG